MSIDDLLKFVFSLAKDHKPDGWPAIQMQEITPLAEEIVGLRAENEALKAALLKEKKKEWGEGDYLKESQLAKEE